MTEESVLSLARIGIVPVAEVPSIDSALPLAKALWEGGIPCLEVTFRTHAAVEAIADIRSTLPNMLIGAGTVLSLRDVDAAAEARAQFIMTPGFSPLVVRRALDKGIPVFPGVCTPTEIESARSFGIDVVKFFPAEAAGGIPFLRAVSAPFPSVRFVPTGGIGTTQLGSYLDLEQVIACGGSWMVRRDLIENEDFAAIKRLSAEAVSIVRLHRP